MLIDNPDVGSPLPVRLLGDDIPFPELCAVLHRSLTVASRDGVAGFLMFDTDTVCFSGDRIAVLFVLCHGGVPEGGVGCLPFGERPRMFRHCFGVRGEHVLLRQATPPYEIHLLGGVRGRGRGAWTHGCRWVLRLRWSRWQWFRGRLLRSRGGQPVRDAEGTEHEGHEDHPDHVRGYLIRCQDATVHEV